MLKNEVMLKCKKDLMFEQRENISDKKSKLKEELLAFINFLDNLFLNCS